MKTRAGCLTAATTWWRAERSVLVPAHSCFQGWIEQPWSAFEMLDGSESDGEDTEADVLTSEAAEAEGLEGV